MGDVYIPEFEGDLKWYSIAIIKSRFKYLSKHYDFEDLLQESFLVFSKCSGHYSQECSMERKTFKYFKFYYRRALINKLSDLICESRKLAPSADMSKLQKTCSDDFLAWFKIIESAPSDVKEVLRIILYSPSEIFVKMGLRKYDARWGNKMFDKVLGFYSEKSYMKRVKKYLENYSEK